MLSAPSPRPIAKNVASNLKGMNKLLLIAIIIGSIGLSSCRTYVNHSKSYYKLRLEKVNDNELTGISGTVKYEDVGFIEPAIGAEIILDNNVVAKTDRTGAFNFNVPPGDYYLQFKFTSFETIKTEIIKVRQSKISQMTVYFRRSGALICT